MRHCPLKDLTNKDDTLGLDFIVKNILDQEFVTNSRSSAGSLFTIIPREANRYMGVKLSAYSPVSCEEVSWFASSFFIALFFLRRK